MTDVVVVMRLAGDNTDALKDDLTALLGDIEDAIVTDSSVDAALGMTAKELVLTVTVSFATSVSANFATKAIENALEGSVPENVAVEEIYCEAPSEGEVAPNESQQ